MNQTQKLTLLGCSSSLALILATTPIATAGELSPQDAAIVDLPPVTTETVTNFAESDPYTVLGGDTIGNLAIERYGCDCRGCRNVVVSNSLSQ
jgi:hypothetical protein